ncbi:MAG: acyl-CoA dehydrogenase family protein [Thermodesulfobacteriota bacterium]
MIAADNKELKLLNKSAIEFARKELAPNREENDRFPFGPFFDGVLDKAFAADFFHTTLPEESGGIGQGIRALCILLEGLCQEDSSLGGIIYTNAAAQEIMLAAGAGELLKKKISGAGTAKEFLIALPVFNNPGEDDHVIRAEKKDDQYRLSGDIEYVVLGGMAGHALIPGVIAGQKKYSFFLAALDQKSLTISPPVHSLGLHACPAVDISLKDATGELIGQEEEGAVYFETMADRMSVAAAAMSTGIMKGAFKEAFDYSKARSQGGREIINWSEIQMILANMAVMTKNAELAVARACQAVDAGEKGWESCSRAVAIHVQAMAGDLTTDGIQVMGGVGYMKDFGQEKRFRDARHIQSLLGMVPMKKINFIRKMI